MKVDLSTWLAWVASRLELRFTPDFRVELADGRSLQADGHFPDLGSRLGMVIFGTISPDLATLDELSRPGFGYSVLSPGGSIPDDPDELVDLSGAMSMFIDWGWTGPPELRPAWLTDPPPDCDDEDDDPA